MNLMVCEPYILARNSNVVAQVRELKKKLQNHEITEEEFKAQSTEIKKDESAPVVSIKGTDAASYKNLVDALDEMQICDISRYAIVPLSEGRFVVDRKPQIGRETSVKIVILDNKLISTH